MTRTYVGPLQREQSVLARIELVRRLRLPPLPPPRDRVFADRRRPKHEAQRASRRRDRDAASRAAPAAQRGRSRAQQTARGPSECCSHRGEREYARPQLVPLRGVRDARDRARACAGTPASLWLTFAVARGDCGKEWSERRLARALALWLGSNRRVSISSCPLCLSLRPPVEFSATAATSTAQRAGLSACVARAQAARCKAVLVDFGRD